MLITYQLILIYFFKEIISCFVYIFGSKFLAYVSFNHFFKVIIYFQLSQEFLISYFSSLFSHLLQILERTNFFSKIHILGFLNFLYTPQMMQNIFFILTLLIIENILVLFYHSFHIG